MKNSKLDQLIQDSLGLLMTKNGYSYERMTFFRELPSQVIHLLGFEFDPHSSETFRVVCGASTRLISQYASLHPRDMGLIGGQHLTRQGLDINSGHWPCSDETIANNSLAEIASLIPTYVEPWFEAHETLSSIAAEMNSQHFRQGLYKAKLYLLDNDQIHAETALREFLQTIQQPKPWNNPVEMARLQQQAEALLTEITMKAS